MILSGSDWTKRGLWAVMAVGLAVGSARCSLGGESTASSGGGAGGATSSTAASSSQGSGGSCTDAGASCERCLECLGRGPCAAEKTACYGDVECDAFQECIEKVCGDNDTACKDGCLKDHAKGAEEHNALYHCLLCAPACSAACPAGVVETYPALSCP